MEQRQSVIKVIKTSTFDESYEKFIVEHISTKNPEKLKKMKDKIEKLRKYLKSVINQIRENPISSKTIRLQSSKYGLKEIPGWIYLKYRDKLNRKTAKDIFHKKIGDDKSSWYIRVIYAYNPEKKLLALMLVYTHYQYNDAPSSLLKTAIDEIKEEDES